MLANIAIALTVVLERYLITSAADPRRSRSDSASFTAHDSWPDPDTISLRFGSQLGRRLVATLTNYANSFGFGVRGGKR
jgi:hypothetical protein